MGTNYDVDFQYTAVASLKPCHVTCHVTCSGPTLIWAESLEYCAIIYHMYLGMCQKLLLHIITIFWGNNHPLTTYFKVPRVPRVLTITINIYIYIHVIWINCHISPISLPKNGVDSRHGTMISSDLRRSGSSCFTPPGDDTIGKHPVGRVGSGRGQNCFSNRLRIPQSIGRTW